ncbi:TPA: GNAT family N-acetyltransferase, partial [Acinetobacter baumannii]|nr:GNAT family N-acetyltransferase [Acinetobacter baumannii]
MQVRAANLNDLDTLVDFGKRLTKESPIFSKQGFDE